MKSNENNYHNLSDAAKTLLTGKKFNIKFMLGNIKDLNPQSQLLP